MTLTHQLPRRIYPPELQALGENVRSTQDILNKVPVVEQRKIEALYAEPMTLKAKEEPFSIELVRIVNLFAPEQPVSACFGFVHFVWRPQLGGAAITKIGGMDMPTNGGIKYRFYYRITYDMVG